MVINQTARPILYSFRRCPYAMRARMAMAVSKIDFEIREISLKNKPAAMLRASPKGTVPVLVLTDDLVIDESLEIMIWALNQHDPERWLCADEKTNAVMDELITTNDGPFKFHLDRMKYANRYDNVVPAEHRDAAVKLLSNLEARLTEHGFLLGDSPKVADIAIFPFVRQFAHADEKAFTALPLRNLQTWLTKWEGSDLFQSIMIKHPQWQPND